MEPLYTPQEMADITELFNRPEALIFRLKSGECDKIAIMESQKLAYWLIGQRNLSQIIKTLVEQDKENRTDARTLSEEEIAKLSSAQKMLIKVQGKLQFFKNLSDYEMIRLTEDVIFLKLSKGEVIFEQSSRGNEIYFILGGAVVISVSDSCCKSQIVKRTPLAKLRQGQFFGEMSPFTLEPRSARSTAIVDNTSLLSFSIKQQIEPNMYPAYQTLFQNFVQSIADKLRSMNQAFSKRSV